MKKKHGVDAFTPVMAVCQICRVLVGNIHQVAYIDRDEHQIRSEGVSHIRLCVACRGLALRPVIINTEAFGPPVNEDHLVLSILDLRRSVIQ